MPPLPINRRNAGYPICFLLTGGAISACAISLGGYWNLLHWLSLSFFALTAGHCGLGPKIFGKRENGSIPLLSKSLHFPYFLYSNILWRLICCLSRENAFDRVTENLFLGRRLRPEEFPQAIANCLDLTSEFEEPAAIVRKTNYIGFPLLDGGVPANVAMVDRVFGKFKAGPIYIHCAQGHGRTGLIALLLLLRMSESATLEEGLNKLTRVRTGVRLNSMQYDFAARYFSSLTGGDKLVQEIL